MNMAPAPHSSAARAATDWLLDFNPSIRWQVMRDYR